MKKLTGILFAAAFSILSASCISFKNTAYVEGSDDFTVIPVTSKSFGKILQWNGYELSMSSVERDISQKTVFGVGKKAEQFLKRELSAETVMKYFLLPSTEELTAGWMRMNFQAPISLMKTLL